MKSLTFPRFSKILCSGVLEKTESKGARGNFLGARKSLYIVIRLVVILVKSHQPVYLNCSYVNYTSIKLLFQKVLQESTLSFSHFKSIGRLSLQEVVIVSSSTYPCKPIEFLNYFSKMFPYLVYLLQFPIYLFFLVTFIPFFKPYTNISINFTSALKNTLLLLLLMQVCL